MKKIKTFFKIAAVVMLLVLTSKVQAQDPYIGEIRMFAFNYAPVDWLPCNGQLLPINQYQALFALIGTTYGGNGTTNFALPDLRGRVPMGFGQGPGLTSRNIGNASGNETTTLLATQMPAHTHTVNAQTSPGNTNVPTNNILGNAGGFDNDFTNATANTIMSGTMVNSAGGSQPFSIIQPSLAVGYCISINGLWPQRP